MSWEASVALETREFLEALMSDVSEKAAFLQSVVHGDAVVRDRVETLAGALADLDAIVRQARNELVLAATAAGIAYEDLAEWCGQPVRILEGDVEEYRSYMLERPRDES